VNAILFFIVGLVYSTVGFGGGSMYLVVLSQGGMMESIPLRMHGLISNAMVTGLGEFQRRAHLENNNVLRKSNILLLISVIFCAIAVLNPLEQFVFEKVLGCMLILGGLAMAIQNYFEHRNMQLNIPEMFVFIIAGILGAVAGFTGIGGGIYITPILYLTRWDTPERIAHFASKLIFINSMVSLAIGYFMGWPIFNSVNWILPFSALLGGAIGVRLGIKRLKKGHVILCTALLLSVAGFRMLCK
jgi:uncharacterized membrane protein YfcA